jgi:diguanylate cyclase (GGDEF)-like protein
LWTAPLCLLLIFAVRRLARSATEHQIASLHDPLTGLPNRSLLLTRLRQALDEARRPGRKVAVLMIDLDRFKEVNDTLGHAAGDDLLKQVTARLTGIIKPHDTVARLGGDEFAIVLQDATERSAAALGERLTASLSEAFRVDEVTLNIGASVGIALSPDHASDAEFLIRYADLALYTAKVDRGGYAVYDPLSEEHATEQPVLMGELRRGIERGELVVHYQPKISVYTGRICGAEALVRWQHPTRGLLSPGQFLPAAETTGLIAPLTHEVIRQALTAVGRWRAAGLDISVAINVSARQVANLDLPDQIEAALAHHGLPGDVLIVEMTESCLMGDQLRSRTVLNRLRAAGIGLSVDDFGTGYSSFTHLRDLPVSEIKIDRSFVTDAAASPANAAIVKSTVELAHNLGLTVVAEGVESPPCLEMLTAIGCDLVQGYLFARPMPADDLVTWAAAQVQLVSAGKAPIPC